MRVGLLTYGVERPLSGVNRYTLELGTALKAAGECEMVYLTPYSQGPFRGLTNGHSWRLPMCSRLPALMLLGGPLMELAADRLHLDLLHDPSGVSPFTVKHTRKSVKRVTTISSTAGMFPPRYGTSTVS